MVRHWTTLVLVRTRSIGRGAYVHMEVSISELSPLGLNELKRQHRTASVARLNPASMEVENSRCPTADCLRSEDGHAGDGLTWVDTPDYGVMEVYCDMSTDGEGWMRVMNTTTASTKAVQGSGMTTIDRGPPPTW